jgi:Mg-chelatase subunit ChlD
LAILAWLLLLGSDTGSAGAQPAVGCSIRATRSYAVAGGSAQWGDEVDVRLTAEVSCDSAAVASHLELVETLSSEAPWVPGFGTPPAAVDGPRLTWRVDNPPLWPQSFEVTYRVYALPDPTRLAGEGGIPVSWPLDTRLTVDGVDQATELLPDPLLVRVRDGAACALARAREVAPELVKAGSTFTVTLRLTINRCPPFASRTRLMLALQPPTSAEEATRMSLAVAGLLGTLAPENAVVGVLINRREGPVLVPPTGDYALVADAVRNQAVDPAGGADAAQAVAAAIPLLPKWSFHHSVVLHITAATAPPAPEAALRQQLASAQAQGVELATVCVGGGCDPGLTVAHAVADWPALRRQLTGGLLDTHRGPPLVLQGMEVEDRLLRFVHVEESKAVPTAERMGGNTLAWRGLPARVGQVVTLSYPARVDIWGRLPIAAGGSAWLVYGDGQRQRFELPRGAVQVARDPAAEARPCQPEVAKEAVPARLPLGDSVEVRLSFGAVCPGEVNPVDVVLVQDVSGSMSGPPLMDAKAAMLGFLNTVDTGSIRVGLVAFDHDIKARVALTDDLDVVRAAVAGLQASGGTDIAHGLIDAGHMLKSRRPEATPVVVLMTDGFNNSGPDPMIAAALDLRTDGILVAAVCFGGQCDAALPDVATDLSLFYNVLGGNDLLVLFAELGAQLRQARLASLHLTDTLPPHMRYLPGSAVPAPAAVLGDTLVWDLVDPPAGGVSIRYRAEPLLLGPQTTNVSARAEYVDDRGRRGAADFPVPQVETYIPDPEGPCNPSLTKTAARSQLRLGESVEVQLGLRVACPRRQAALDVVMVLDHSASMGFLNRLTNVKLAAAAFLEALEPAVTRVGLVTFGTDVTGRYPLSTNYATVRAAVDGLRPNGETGIGQALNAAGEVLLARRPEALPVVLLLTDGGNTAGPGPMLAAAARLKDGGARLITVCAGDCDKELAAVASAPEYAFQVTDSAALVALFQNIAADLGGTRPHGLVITDAFPGAVEVVAGSLNPPPAQFAAGQAEWRFPALPTGGLTLTYQIRPLVAGHMPANRFARLDYRYGLDGTGHAYFPVPILDVIDPNAPTPTSTPPTPPTPTPTGHTVTPTPTPPGPTPSATPTSRPARPIYLPWCTAPGGLR